MFNKNLLLQHIQNRQRTIEEQLIGIGDADAPQTKPKKKDPNKPTDAGMLSVEPPEDLAVDNTRGTAGTRPISDMELNYLTDPTAREAYMRARRENPNANEAEAFGAAADILRQGVIDRGVDSIDKYRGPEDILNLQRAAYLVGRLNPHEPREYQPETTPHKQVSRMNHIIRTSRMNQEELYGALGNRGQDYIDGFEIEFGGREQRGRPRVQRQPTNEQFFGIPSGELVSRTIQPVVAKRQYLDHAIDDNKIKNEILVVSTRSQNHQSVVDSLKKSNKDSPLVRRAKAGELDLSELPDNWDQLNRSEKTKWHIERAKAVIRNNMITMPDERIRDYKREDIV